MSEGTIQKVKIFREKDYPKKGQLEKAANKWLKERHTGAFDDQDLHYVGTGAGLNIIVRCTEEV